MARFGVHPLFGMRPLPISPRAGFENKKCAKSDITRGQDAKKGLTKAKKRATVIWVRCQMNFPKPLTPRLYMKFL